MRSSLDLLPTTTSTSMTEDLPTSSDLSATSFNLGEDEFSSRRRFNVSVWDPLKNVDPLFKYLHDNKQLYMYGKMKSTILGQIASQITTPPASQTGSQRNSLGTSLEDSRRNSQSTLQSNYLSPLQSPLQSPDQHQQQHELYMTSLSSISSTPRFTDRRIMAQLDGGDQSKPINPIRLETLARLESQVINPQGNNNELESEDDLFNQLENLIDVPSKAEEQFSIKNSSSKRSSVPFASLNDTNSTRTSTSFDTFSQRNSYNDPPGLEKLNDPSATNNHDESNPSPFSVLHQSGMLTYYKLPMFTESPDEKDHDNSLSYIQEDDIIKSTPTKDPHATVEPKVHKFKRWAKKHFNISSKTTTPTTKPVTSDIKGDDDDDDELLTVPTMNTFESNCSSPTFQATNLTTEEGMGLDSDPLNLHNLSMESEAKPESDTEPDFITNPNPNSTSELELESSAPKPTKRRARFLKVRHSPSHSSLLEKKSSNNPKKSMDQSDSDSLQQYLLTTFRRSSSSYPSSREPNTTTTTPSPLVNQPLTTKPSPSSLFSLKLSKPSQLFPKKSNVANPSNNVTTTTELPTTEPTSIPTTTTNGKTLKSSRSLLSLAKLYKTSNPTTTSTNAQLKAGSLGRATSPVLEEE